jgi:hypothetical protein
MKSKVKSKSWYWKRTDRGGAVLAKMMGIPIKVDGFNGDDWSKWWVRMDKVKRRKSHEASW